MDSEYSVDIFRKRRDFMKVWIFLKSQDFFRSENILESEEIYWKIRTLFEK